MASASGDNNNMISDDTAALVASVKAPPRFADVFERHVVTIYRYLARRVGVELAEDLTSATFAEAFRNRERYDPKIASPRAWLFGIATSHVMHHRRSEARRLGAHARLDAALALIGADLRDVLLLTAIAELTYEECAAALAIPIGTVRSRLARARRELRTLLEDPPELLTARHLTEGNCT